MFAINETTGCHLDEIAANGTYETMRALGISKKEHQKILLESIKELTGNKGKGKGKGKKDGTVEETPCVVCMDKKATHVIAPCGHQCVCGECCVGVRKQYGNCPVCRGSFVSAIKVFRG